MNLPTNVGGDDKALRFGLGAGLLLASAFLPMHRGLRTLASAGGTAVFVTALTGYCPLNQALGIDTGDGGEALSGTEGRADTLAPGGVQRFV